MIHQHARMTGSRFENVDLADAVFDDVNLQGARFSNVNLTGAEWRNVSLRNATILDADIEGLRIRGVLVSDLLAAWDARPTPP